MVPDFLHANKKFNIIVKIGTQISTAFPEVVGEGNGRFTSNFDSLFH